MTQEGEAGVLVPEFPLPVLAVHYFRFIRVQPQSDLGHPGRDCPPHIVRLAFADAMHDRIISVTFERDGREFPGHPLIARVVHEQVGEDGTDRRTLRGNTA